MQGWQKQHHSCAIMGRVATHADHLFGSHGCGLVRTKPQAGGTKCAGTQPAVTIFGRMDCSVACGFTFPRLYSFSLLEHMGPNPSLGPYLPVRRHGEHGQMWYKTQTAERVTLGCYFAVRVTCAVSGCAAGSAGAIH